MLRNRLMTGLALLVLLGAIAGCGGDIGQSPEEANVDLERAVEDSIVVLEQPAEEANLDLERAVEESIVVLEQPAEETNTFTIKGWVTVDAYRYDAATGTYIHFYHDEGSNTITTIGKDWIEDQLGDSPSTDPAKWISLSPNTADPPPDTWEQLGGIADDEIITGGLERAAGTYASTGVGVWTITKTFTATAAHTAVQQTGLQWVVTLGSDGNLLAANHFTAVDLAIDDSLTITWTLTLGP